MVKYMRFYNNKSYDSVKYKVLHFGMEKFMWSWFSGM